MGYNAYNFTSRSSRTQVYQSQSVHENFGQRKLHESMDPRKALLREARDSDLHPLSLPIGLGLDVTGSMEEIPLSLIRDGLPKLISSLMERGVTDPTILFMGIGDSRCDKAPFQVGQFESGDSEMDMWLGRTYLEGGGGGNMGESYTWAWWFAANRCKTDAWDKRGQKGFIFTVGDDNCHGITSTEFMEVLGIEMPDMTAEELYAAASEKWNVYHIGVHNRSQTHWKSFMGENVIQLADYYKIPETMASIISSHVITAKPEKRATDNAPETQPVKPATDSIIML